MILFSPMCPQISSVMVLPAYARACEYKKQKRMYVRVDIKSKIFSHGAASVCTCGWVGGWVGVGVHVCVHVMCVCVYVCVLASAQMSVYVCVCVSVCLCVSVCVCVYTQICACARACRHEARVDIYVADEMQRFQPTTASQASSTRARAHGCGESCVCVQGTLVRTFHKYAEMHAGEGRTC